MGSRLDCKPVRRSPVRLMPEGLLTLVRWVRKGSRLTADPPNSSSRMGEFFNSGSGAQPVVRWRLLSPSRRCGAGQPSRADPKVLGISQTPEEGPRSEPGRFILVGAQ